MRQVPDGHPDHFGECDACGKPIMFGNALVSIDRNIEQADASEEYPGGEITVLDSQTLMQLYAACGSQIDTDALTEVLQQLLVHGNPEEN